MGRDQSGPSLSVGEFSSIGTYNVVCVLVGMGIGWWADASVGWTPVLTLAGLAAGVGLGVAGTWLRIRPLLRGDAAEHWRAADGDQREPH